MQNKEYLKRELDIELLMSERSMFLFGPRQCGKTSLVRKTLMDVVRIDLLRNEIVRQLSLHPSDLEGMCAPGKVVAIDEIQKMPDLLDEVHRLIEEKGVRFLLTGSSARKLRRAGVNLLGGRAGVRNLGPFSAYELGDRFNLTKAINYGTLPSVWNSSVPDELLSDYVSLYLREEIMVEGATRNIPAFGRFLDVAALSNGQQINFQKIANDAQVARSTVQEYYGILTETLLGSEVPAWKTTQSRKTVSASKYYLFDLGVVRCLQRRGLLTPGTSEYGAAFEHWVFTEITAFLAARGIRNALAYWRRYDGKEVDFILEDSVAIEVKATDRVSSADLRGLKALNRETPMKHNVVVSRDPVARLMDGILIVPYSEFPARLRAGAWQN